jgi:ABC-type nitrate/sulfonate/bicarbonate transport system substrate-binding protein
MKTKLFTRSYAGFVTLILFALLLSGCGVSNSAPKDKVTVQLAWFHQIEYTGFYVAAQKGYYTDENIDITLVAGNYDVDPIAELTNGNAQFAISRSVNTIIAKSKGQDVVAIGTVFRKDPFVLVSLKKANIKTPQDLVGKTIGIPTSDPAFIENVQFMAMMKQLKIDTSTIKFVIRDNADPIAIDLQSGKVDADAGLFATNDLITAQIRGLDINTLFYSDYNVGFYANPIITSGAMLKNNPDLVKRFMRATLRGYQYALEHSDEAVADTLKYDAKLDPTLETAQMKAQIPLIDTGDQPIGWMDADVWQNTMDILLQGGFIPAAVDIKSIYTNDYIK